MNKAEEALDNAKILMDAMPNKKVIDYIYHWNQLLMYLETQVRESKKVE